MQKIKKLFSKKIALIITCIVAVLFSTFYIYFVARPIAVGMEYKGDYVVGDISADVVIKVKDGKRMTLQLIQEDGTTHTNSLYYYVIDGYIVTDTESEVDSFDDFRDNIKANYKNLTAEEKKDLFRGNAFVISKNPDEGISIKATCTGQIVWTVVLGVLELAILTVAGFSIFLNVKKKKAV